MGRKPAGVWSNLLRWLEWMMQKIDYPPSKISSNTRRQSWRTRSCPIPPTQF